MCLIKTLVFFFAITLRIFSTSILGWQCKVQIFFALKIFWQQVTNDKMHLDVSYAINCKKIHLTHFIAFNSVWGIQPSYVIWALVQMQCINHVLQIAILNGIECNKSQHLWRFITHLFYTSFKGSACVHYWKY